MPSSSSEVTTTSPTTLNAVSVDVSFSNVQIEYENVTLLSLEEITQLEDITEEWFDGFYNENGGGRRSMLMVHSHTTTRDLQRNLVRNMVSSMAIEEQEVLDGSNTITFTQQMMYEALPGASEPEVYLDLAYRNIVAIGQLRRSLKESIPAFANVGFVTLQLLAAAPAPSPTMAPTEMMTNMTDTDAPTVSPVMAPTEMVTNMTDTDAPTVSPVMAPTEMIANMTDTDTPTASPVIAPTEMMTNMTDMAPTSGAFGMSTRVTIVLLLVSSISCL